jgi:hypothetical protein
MEESSMSHGTQAIESITSRHGASFRSLLDRIAGVELFREANRELLRKSHTYALMVAYLLIVAAVSLYDMMLTVKYAISLKYLEQNPLGRWMMRLDELENGMPPDLTLFLSVKSLGTVLVMGVIVALIRYRARLGHPVAVGVSLFQLMLAWYLTVGETQSFWYNR